MQSIKRAPLIAVAVLAVAVLAVAAPAATAVPVADRNTSAPLQQQAPTLADVAAHREAISSAQWEQANRAPVIQLTRGDGGGLDWAPAIVGGVLLFGGLAATPTLRRRRSGAAATA